MKLPHPKKIALALPANLKCGKPKSIPKTGYNWPTQESYAGVHQIEAQWVKDHRDEVYIFDVRDETEFSGELGHIEGAISVPLAVLEDKVTELPRDKPAVVVCRSGRRSALATQVLSKAGFEAANLESGMLGWSSLGYPVS